MELRKFIIKLFVFALISFPILTFKNYFFYYTGLYKSSVNGSEVYTSLKKSKMKKKVKKLIIGDSVAKQLYDNQSYNADIFSLTCNQAISMVGQFILLSNFIKTNREDLPEEVILLVTPDSFLNNLDQKFTYHFFLKPFYSKENEQYFDQLCKDLIHKIPYYYTSTIPLIKSSNWSPEYNTKKDSVDYFISPISAAYLVKIRELCASNNIKFDLIPTPVKYSHYKRVVKRFKSQNVFWNNGQVSRDLVQYFHTMKPMPDILFRDHNHLKKQYIPADYLKLKG